MIIEKGREQRPVILEMATLEASVEEHRRKQRGKVKTGKSDVPKQEKETLSRRK